MDKTTKEDLMKVKVEIEVTDELVEKKYDEMTQGEIAIYEETTQIQDLEIKIKEEIEIFLEPIIFKTIELKYKKNMMK